MAARELLIRAFAIDPRSLAALRIGLGGLILGDLFSRISNFAMLYTDAGILPRRLLASSLASPPSLYKLDGSFGFAALLCCAAALAAIALILGYRTRLAALLCWLLLFSLQTRNPFVLTFGDHVLRVVLFWSLFLPMGGWGSLDARLGRTREPPRRVLSAGGVALLGQVIFVYTFTGVLKSPEEWSASGNAVYWAMSQDGWVRPLAVFLRGYPDLLALATPGVRWAEILAPLFLLIPLAPLRTLAVVGFWLFQLSLGLSFHVGIFPFVNVVVLLPFLPGWAWERIGVGLAPAGDTPAPAPRRRAAAIVAQGVAALLFAYVFLYNLAVIGIRTEVPMRLEPWGFVLGLNQRWEMYAPGVDHYSVRHAIAGSVEDGRVLDLARGGEFLDWEHPEKTGPEYHPYRWAVYLEGIRYQDPALRERLARWHCRRWNRERGDGARMERVEIWLVTRPTPAPGERARKGSRRLIGARDCGAGGKPAGAAPQG